VAGEFPPRVGACATVRPQTRNCDCAGGRELRSEHQPDLSPKRRAKRDGSVLPDRPLSPLDQDDRGIPPAPLVRSGARRDDAFDATTIEKRRGRCRAAAGRTRYVSVAGAWRIHRIVDDRHTMEGARTPVTEGLCMDGAHSRR
jgi:hypothetical protein